MATKQQTLNIPFDSTKISWALIVLIVAIAIAGSVYWYTNRQSYDTAFPGITGIQGTITHIDQANQTFTIERERIIRKKSDTDISLESKTFVVHWNESTQFLTYPSLAEIQQEGGDPSDSSILAVGVNLIVTPREKAGNVVTAVTVRAVPGPSQAVEVDNPPGAESYSGNVTSIDQAARILNLGYSRTSANGEQENFNLLIRWDSQTRFRVFPNIEALSNSQPLDGSSSNLQINGLIEVVPQEIGEESILAKEINILPPPF